MLEAGGLGTGSFWSAIPDRPVLRWPDAHWRVGTRYRLRLDLAPACACCCIPRADGTPCGAPLNASGAHLMLCKAGPARLRPHRALARRLMALVRAAGAHADYERSVPDMYSMDSAGLIHEAILDVVITFPGATGVYPVDCSIRAPQASRYVDTQDRPGVAAATGESEKLVRYGAEVLPLVFEPAGRLGPKSAETLEHLAHAARDAGVVTGGRPLARSWRLELESAMLFALADVMLLGLGDAAAQMAAPRRRKVAASRAARAAASAAMQVQPDVGDLLAAAHAPGT